MQREAAPRAAHRTAVAPVANDRMARRHRVPSDLMRPAGLELHIEDGHAGPHALSGPLRHSGLSVEFR